MGYENPVFRERRRRRAAEEAERERIRQIEAAIAAERERIRLLQLSYQERINKDQPHLDNPEENDPGPVPKVNNPGEEYYDAYIALKDVQDRKEAARILRQNTYGKIAEQQSIIRKTDPTSPDYSPTITSGPGGYGGRGSTGEYIGEATRTVGEGKRETVVDKITGKTVDRVTKQIKMTFRTACGDIIKMYNETQDAVKEFVKDKDTTELRKAIIDTQTSVDELSRTFVDYDTQLTELLEQTERNLLKITKNNEYISLLHLEDLFKKYYKYGEIDVQNSLLNREIDVLGETYSADSQKVLYEKRHIEELSIANMYLFWIYWIFVCIFIAVLAFLNQSDIRIKIGMIVLAILYPFFIYYIESKMYRLYSYFFIKR
jgi:hypothetical protein